MNRKLLVLFAVACCLSLAQGAQAEDGSIGVYLDTDGTQCQGATSAGLLNGSVWANLSGQTAGGITGAEFRIDPLNGADYLFVATPNPSASVVLGNPFDSIGVNIAFASCQAGARVQLFTFQVVELSPTEDNWLTVRQHYNFSNPNFPCALVTLCDAPAFTKVCLGAPDSDHWRAVINPSVGTSGDCAPVAVQSTTWSGIKGFYRD